MRESKLAKHSVALAVRKAAGSPAVLLVRRPGDDPEFPGMWGLPAASCRPGETPEAAARRIGTQKLGTPVDVGDRLALGRQERPGYTLEMSLYAARLGRPAPRLPGGKGCGGLTLYTDWRWADPSELADAAEIGSLCSRLLLDSSRH